MGKNFWGWVGGRKSFGRRIGFCGGGFAFFGRASVGAVVEAGAGGTVNCGV